MAKTSRLLATIVCGALMAMTGPVAGFCVVVVLAAAIQGCSPAPSQQAPPVAAVPDRAMQLHHLHGLMAHGFEMALEGAALRMNAQMNMTPAIDPVAASHGATMMTEGAAAFERVMNGPEMTALHGAGTAEEAMTYSHDLGKAMTAVLDLLKQMEPAGGKPPADMAMHHMHITLAHAAEMASQGASLNMEGSMKMAGGVDDARQHGQAMFAHARALLEQTTKGAAMDATHASAPAAGMQATHDLADAVSKVIDLLAKMP